MRRLKELILRKSPIIYALIWGAFLPISMYGIQFFVEENGWHELWGNDCSLFLFPIGVLGAIYVAELSYYIWEMTLKAKRKKAFLPYKFGTIISWILFGLAILIALTIGFTYANSPLSKQIIALVTWFILSTLKYSTEIMHVTFENVEPLKIIE